MKITTPLPGTTSKLDWDPGPWLYEHDRLEWEEFHFPVLLRRNAAGSLCGYVVIPEEHPWHGLAPEKVPAYPHHGIDFSHTPTASMTHAKAPPDAWWIGFSCSGPGDYLPALMHLDDCLRRGVAYRNEQYVLDEIKKLAAGACAAWVDMEPKTPGTAFPIIRSPNRGHPSNRLPQVRRG